MSSKTGTGFPADTLMSSLSGFEQEAKGELLLFSVSFLKDIGERAGLFSGEGSTINAL